MISNEKQYKISKKRVADIQLKIAETGKDTRHDPLRNKLILASLNNQLKQSREEVTQYESLKKKKTVTIKERPLSQLPQLIIEYKIASGLTQKEFSLKLGMKEQQLQRYEANRFKGISFDNLLQMITAMDVDLMVKPLVRRTRRK
jgi:HTH-type transcriptional regulator/antitoxin HigA